MSNVDSGKKGTVNRDEVMCPSCGRPDWKEYRRRKKVQCENCGQWYLIEPVFVDVRYTTTKIDPA